MENKQTHSNWLEKHHQAQPILSDVINTLRSLAVSFDETGNEKMYEYLIILSKKIENAKELECECVGGFLNEAVSSTFQSSVNMINGTLAIVASQEKTKES